MCLCDSPQDGKLRAIACNAIATAGQTIITAATLAGADSCWQTTTRQFDLAKVKGKMKPVVVYQLPWREQDLTIINTSASAGSSTPEQPRLVAKTPLGITVPRVKNFQRYLGFKFFIPGKRYNRKTTAIDFTTYLIPSYIVG